MRSPRAPLGLAILLALSTLLALPAGAGAQGAVEGDLIQGAGDDKVYLVTGGQRRWISDGVSFARLQERGQANPARLRRVPFEEIERLPAGAPFLRVRPGRDTVSGRVYILVQEQDWPTPRKRWIKDLDSFGQLGIDWGSIEDVRPELLELAPDGPGVAFRPLSAEPAQQAACSERPEPLSVVPAWQLQVEDERLYCALALAGTFNTDWATQVGARLAAQGTSIQWGDLREELGGQFSVRRNRITINRALQGESSGVVAAAVAHEVFHAVNSTPTEDVEACFREEIDAASIGAQTWASLPAAWRGQGAWSGYLDVVVRAWRAGRLEGAIRNDPGYQRLCGERGAA